MAKCPICETESDDVLCPKCGYNLSIDQKFHLLSSKMSSKEIEDYQNQIETHKFIYYKLRNEKDYDQQLIQENIELQQQISILQERINHLLDEEDIADDTIVQINNNIKLHRLLEGFDMFYVFFVPFIVIALYYGVDVITQYFGQYWMFFNYSLVKVVCHIVFSSLIIGYLVYLLVNFNDMGYEDDIWDDEFSSQNNSLLMTVCFVLILFSMISVFSILLYYYVSFDKKLYSLQYLLSLLLNLPIVMASLPVFLDYTTSHRNAKWIYYLFPLIIIVISYVLYYDQLCLLDFVFIEWSCTTIWIGSAISSFIIAHDLSKKGEYTEDGVAVSICMIGIYIIYMVAYFIIRSMIIMSI